MQRSTFLGLHSVVALIVIVAGAIGSFGLMLYAARHQQSLLLNVLFTGWVLAPFVALIWAYVVSKQWANRMQKTLYSVMFLTTAGSLGVYGTLALGTLRAKNGFIYLVVPAGTWLFMGIVFALVT